jgi:hypothetical protein
VAGARRALFQHAIGRPCLHALDGEVFAEVRDELLLRLRARHAEIEAVPAKCLRGEFRVQIFVRVRPTNPAR